MPNPVAVNDLQPISGSLQTSRVSYGVETAGKNYGQDYNGTTWYSDIPNNGTFYTIISDNYTANYYISRSNAEGAYVEGGLPAVDEYSAPVFWTTVGTSSLDIITTVNGLPDRVGQIPFSNGAEALNWIASSSNYFAVGPDYYAQIDADNLQLYLDANQVISYPTTQSTWYDLSGNNLKANLVNGPVWDSNGWFDFDGVDDYGVFNTSFNLPGEFTVTCFFKQDTNGERSFLGRAEGPTKLIFLTGYNLFFGGFDNGSSNSFPIGNGSSLLGKWNFLTATRDSSGGLKGSLNGAPYTSGGVLTGNFQPNLLAKNINGQYWDGGIQNMMIYNKSLSEDELRQNYYGGPIVTNGLVYAIDAGNLVSYPKSGTTAYALTGSNNGILTNGVGYNNENGGTWTFDGVDDYIDCGNPSISAGKITVNAWVNLNAFSSPAGKIVDSALNSWHLAVLSSGIPYFFNGVTYHTTGTPLSLNTWYMLTGVQGTTLDIYVNGVLANSLASNINVTTNNVWIGAWQSGTRPSNGKISNVQIYNRALTAAEVLQQYNATK